MDVLRFATAELARGFGLHDVVDPGATAADRLLCRLATLELRYLREDRPRLLGHALRVGEVARVLERDRQRQRVTLGAWLELGEQLGRVAYAGRKAMSALRVFRIVRQ